MSNNGAFHPLLIRSLNSRYPAMTKRLNKNRFLLPATLLTTALLTACGGGGSAEPTAITEDNVASATSDAFEMMDAMLSNGSSVSFAGNGVSAKATGTNGTPSIAALAVLHTQRADPVGAFNQVGTSALVSNTENCADGGTASFSLNDANNNGELDQADGLTVSFNQCSEFGVTQDGSITVSNISMTNPDGIENGNFSMTVRYDNLTIADAQGSYSLNGQMSLSTMSDNGATTVSISGSSLQISDNGEAGQLREFIASTALHPATSTFSYSLTATAWPEDWSIETPVSFTGTIGAYPTAGMMRVTDASGAIATLTAQGTTVLIEYDGNGDGTPESSTTYTWTEVYAD